MLSFLLPAGAAESAKKNKALAEEIKELVSKELENIKGNVDGVVEETVAYAMEKTERSLERISNEKIMAVNQYSDTVLQEIHKNHQEVMFLYDMLNDKHTNLKSTMLEVNRTVKEAESTFRKLSPEATDGSGERKTEAIALEKHSGQEIVSQEKEVQNPTSQTAMDISFIQEADGQGRNCNDRILQLYREGKSKVSIAKELGLGVGEVKLVIDLYKNM